MPDSEELPAGEPHPPETEEMLAELCDKVPDPEGQEHIPQHPTALPGSPA